MQAAAAEGENETVMVGRFGPRSRIKNGETIDVAVETGALHFFDLETGLGIYSQDEQAKPTTVQRRGRRQDEVPMARVRADRRRAGLRRRGLWRRRRRRRRREGSEDVTGDISVMAIWGGEEQESFQAVIDGFNELYPNVNVKYTSGGDNLAPLLSTAVEGGNPPDIAAIGQPGLMAGFAEQGALPVARRPPRRRSSTTSANPSQTSARSTGRSTGSCSRAPTSRPSGTTSRPSRRRASSAPETWDELNEAARHAQGCGHHPVLGRRRRRLADDGHLREHLPPHRGPEMYDQLVAHEIPWTDQSVKDALTFMAGHRRRLRLHGGRHRGGTADGDAGLGGEGVHRFARGRDGRHRRLRTWRVRDDAGARVGLQRLHVPVHRRLRPVGRRRRRHLRRVQGQPRRGRVPRVPDDPGRSCDLGGARRVLVAEQEPRHGRLPGRDHPDDGRRSRRGRGVPLRPLRPRAVGLRWNRRSRACSRRSPISSRTRTTSTGSRSRWRPTPRRRTAARTLGSDERVRVNGGSPPAGASTGGRRARLLPALRRRDHLPRPALVLLGVWVVYPTIRTIIRSFYDRTATSSSGSTTTRRSSPTTRSSPRSGTTSSGS